MCANKVLLERYKLCIVGNVVMDNGSISKVMCMGTMEMKIVDRVVRILGDVRHIPSLKMNLVLVSRLNTLSYGFFTRNRFMKGGKKNSVIMKR